MSSYGPAADGTLELRLCMAISPNTKFNFALTVRKDRIHVSDVCHKMVAQL